jgi:RNA polymerase sporulation-specific sigma factor
MISTIYKAENNYNSMTDEELIELIKSGDKHAIDFLIEKYKDLVNMKVGKYFMIGAEKEDIMQEGMIG